VLAQSGGQVRGGGLASVELRARSDAGKCESGSDPSDVCRFPEKCQGMLSSRDVWCELRDRRFRSCIMGSTGAWLDGRCVFSVLMWGWSVT